MSDIIIFYSIVGLICGSLVISNLKMIREVNKLIDEKNKAEAEDEL